MCGQVLSWRQHRALSIDQCWLQVLQFLVHLINLLSILLRCNGFTGIQKPVVDQTGSRPLNSDHDLFWCKFGFGKGFKLLLSATTELVIAGCGMKSIFWSHITILLRNSSLLLHRIREDDTSKSRIFFICSQLMRHPLIKLFHLSNLLQMSNDQRMVEAEFLGNFFYNCKRISFDDGSQLVIVNFRWPTAVLLIFKALVSSAKLLTALYIC